MQNLMNTELQKQMNRNSNVIKRKLQKEKLTDAVNMGAVNQKLYDEKMENLGNRK